MDEHLRQSRKYLPAYLNKRSHEEKNDLEMTFDTF